MLAPLLIAIVFLGVYPKPVLDRIEPSVDHVIAHVQYQDPSLHLPAKGVGPVVAVSASQNVDGGPQSAATSSGTSAASSAGTP
jgi:NADH-quinone oxidoreductase subunit M